MEKILRQEEVDALFEAARTSAEEKGPGEVRMRVLPYSYSSAGQISTEQLRAISMLNDLFARNLTHNLSASLRAKFQVSLVSDGDPDLLKIVQFLQASGVAWTPLPETGLLQDLTPFLVPTTFPWTVGVRSDINVPEPSTLALAAVAVAGLAAWGRRRRGVSA